MIFSAIYCDHISKVSFTKDYNTKAIGYCYHSVNVVKDYINWILVITLSNFLPFLVDDNISSRSVHFFTGAHCDIRWCDGGCHRGHKKCHKSLILKCKTHKNKGWTKFTEQKRGHRPTITSQKAKGQVEKNNSKIVHLLIGSNDKYKVLHLHDFYEKLQLDN